MFWSALQIFCFVVSETTIHIYFSCNLVGAISHTLCVLWWHPHLSYLLFKNHSCYCKLLFVLCERWKKIQCTNQNWTWSVRYLKIINTFRKQYLSWTKLFAKLKKWHLNFGRPSVDINFEIAHRTYSISVVVLFPIYRPFPCTMYLDLHWKQGRTKLSWPWYFLGAFRLHSPKTGIRSVLFCLSFRVRN